MIKAIILHGMALEDEYYKEEDAQSNRHWLPWLQNQLLKKSDILAQTPEFWHAFKPDYVQHKSQLEKMGIDEQTILVTYSYSSGLALKWLTETGIKIKKLILVAPWLDIEREYGQELAFDPNPDLVDQVELGIHTLFSLDDVDPIKKSVEFIEENLKNVNRHQFEDYGHFTLSSLGTRQFPELLDICLDGMNQGVATK